MTCKLSYVHIVTVGASLAINYEKSRSNRQVPPSKIEEKLSQMHEAERNQYSKDLVKYINEKESRGELTEASAELNALSRYMNEISLTYLIHTDTNIGRCCAKAIKEYLTGKGIQVAEPIEVKDLHSPETFQRGLANLIREVSEILTHYKKIRICATGGYKPEVAMTSVLGFIARVPVYYIHESFKEEIHLPALPIDWKYEIKRYGKAINTLITTGEKGIDKNEFIEKYGRETYQELKNNWLIEEKENRCVATEISSCLLYTSPSPRDRG